MGRTRNDDDVVVRMLTYCGEHLEPLGMNLETCDDIDMDAYKEIKRYKHLEFDARMDYDRGIRVIKRGGFVGDSSFLAA